jgi:heme/copper-type cytochrome/quinol oxidase subunit 2
MLYEPYIISIIVAIIITIISYFIVQYDNKNKEEPEGVQSIAKKLLLVFVISFVITMAISYGIKYVNKTSFFQKGGADKINMSDRLTIVADDVDFGILED